MSASVIIIVLLCLTKVIYYLPYSVLAASVITSFLSIIFKLSDFPKLFRRSKQEFAIFSICFVVTIIWDTQIGIYTGIVVSIVWLVILMIILYNKQEKYSASDFLYFHIGDSTLYEENKSKL